MKHAFLRSTAAIIGVVAVTAFNANAAITANVFANSSPGTGKYFLNNGSTLSSGDLMRIGTLNIAAYNALSVGLKDNFAAVDALFTEVATLTADATGGFFKFSPGATISPLPGGVSVGDQLYTWVFNAATGLGASQWGIFSSNNPLWLIPNDPGSATLSNASINQQVRSGGTGANAGDFKLDLIPEPGTAVLFLTSLVGLVVFRRRR